MSFAEERWSDSDDECDAPQRTFMDVWTLDPITNATAFFRVTEAYMPMHAALGFEERESEMHEGMGARPTAPTPEEIEEMRYHVGIREGEDPPSREDIDGPSLANSIAASLFGRLPPSVRRGWCDQDVDALSALLARMISPGEDEGRIRRLLDKGLRGLREINREEREDDDRGRSGDEFFPEDEND